MLGGAGVAGLRRVRSITTIAHAASGRIERPAFPAPSDLRGWEFPGKTRAKHAARSRIRVSFVIARSPCDEAIHSCFLPSLRLEGLLRFIGRAFSPPVGPQRRLVWMF